MLLYHALTPCHAAGQVGLTEWSAPQLETLLRHFPTLTHLDLSSNTLGPRAMQVRARGVGQWAAGRIGAVGG